ncbi:MAG: redoxin domain-containing protein [Clostridia bacterium]|nr:redoxin domain-containing protein [Clostridia bacterium]
MLNKGKVKRVIAAFLAVMVFISSAFVMSSTVAAFKPGDVNADGKVSSMDSNILKRYLSGIVISEDMIKLCDINMDGVVSPVDSNLLNRMIVGSYTPDRTEPVAQDFTVYDANGNKVHLSDFAGKPVILNFWASWCTPCKKEMPDFNEKYLEYGDDIQFLMIDFAIDDNIEDAKEYVSEMGFEFPVYFDTDGDASSVYEIFALPTTVFIDADGYIVERYRGTISAETLQSGIDKILK